MHNEQPNQQAHSTLPLRAIASWQLKEIADDPNPSIVAGIPSLQRGAVWDAGQVELLWDSIMRGFPVGAIVVCKKLETQKTRRGKHASGWDDDKVDYHLLDGQQRCNAIALGFLDPCHFDAGGDDMSAALWIDLQPKTPVADSTRQFLFRVLTKAHPWGYQRNDAAGRLGVAAIRDALDKYGVKDKENDRLVRPSICAAWPQESDVPIPFYWLTDAAVIEKLTGARLWEHIRDRCLSLPGQAWATRAAEVISGHLHGTDRALAHIESGLERVKNFSIVALEVPQDVIMKPSIQEEAPEVDEPNPDSRIANVEHLFQRLNSGGTELRGEELIFSMIKAYWPGIEDSFQAIRGKDQQAQQPMAGSHLAALGARAALIDYEQNKDKNKLPAPLSLSRIRNIAHVKKFEDEKNRLTKYFGIDRESPDIDYFHASDLHQNLRQIDQWLLFDQSENDYGLPPVLRTALAQAAPEVFLLLLYFAQKVRHDHLNQAQIAELRQPILGLATALHWFGDDRARAVAELYSTFFCSEEPLLRKTFSGVLSACQEFPEGRHGILRLLTPTDLEASIPRPDAGDKNLKDWDFWQLIGEESSDSANWPFLERLWERKELLLYAQRAFMCTRFQDYDPSRTDTWKESNRPWDYDHLLPKVTLHYNQGTFKRACDQWVDTIGNLRAWPMELNRSKGAALDGIKEDEYTNSFILGAEECKAFSMTKHDLYDAEKSAAFMLASRSRMLRIYAEWFTTLDIGYLLLQTP